MQIEPSDIARIVGTKSYRSSAVKEALSEGRAAYGPINIFVDHQSSMLEVDGPFFNAMFDLREMNQTQDGVSVVDLRETIDEAIAEETEQFLKDQFW